MTRTLQLQAALPKSRSTSSILSGSIKVYQKICYYHTLQQKYSATPWHLRPNKCLLGCPIRASNIVNLEVWESLVVKDRLSDNSREGKHSSSAVRNLLELDFVDLLLTLSLKVLLSKSEITRFTSRSLKHLGDSDP